jgi:hypothetical protein
MDSYFRNGCLKRYKSVSILLFPQKHQGRKIQTRRQCKPTLPGLWKVVRSAASKPMLAKKICLQNSGNVPWHYPLPSTVSGFGLETQVPFPLSPLYCPEIAGRPYLKSAVHIGSNLSGGYLED